jgi:hypothetical protein
MAEGQGSNRNNSDTTASSFALAAPMISLPKGGGAIRGIGEKFAANLVTGTGTMSVPMFGTANRPASHLHHHLLDSRVLGEARNRHAAMSLCKPLS